ncbi:HGxxPAAW family protein [Paraoerskovia marina]|uniref:Uncharacterized protein n=1 Tax=Paraoerskovia marina TaxID=545619 RepID=A0A1H1T9C2_9CELL|nr:HGxxPAAW family protein [Paraoerskovia marina]SDS56209.1 hypothetical protein SAMN04489860_1826 [Paraoerskovia marina]
MVDSTSTQPVADYLPPTVPPDNHGHTTASWTSMIGIMLGSLITAVGLVVATPWLSWVGLAVVLIAVVVGGVMRAMGYGQAPARKS